MNEIEYSRFLQYCCGMTQYQVQELFKQYSWPPRAYHNIQHAINTTILLQEYWNKIKCPADIEDLIIAIAYHDCVYDTKRGDNEYQSKLFCEQFSCYNDIIGNLIMSTDHRIKWSGEPSEGFIRDLDVAGLAHPFGIFKENCHDIRCEYAHTSDEEFTQGRVEFFKKLLSQDNIYCLPLFQEKWERLARENIERWLST